MAAQGIRAASPGDILVVIHDFDARSGDELTLRKSERVELIELDDGFGDGWYLGKHLTRGSTGLFPGVYTTKALATTTRSPVHSRNTSAGQYNSAQPPSQRADTITSALQSGTAARDTPNVAPRPVNTGSYLPRSIGETLNNRHTEESPVMNETLNVIDEHITDLSTPRQSLATPQPRDHDSESDYSGYQERRSFIFGPETDEEDNDTRHISSHLEEAEVRAWDQEQTAQHLKLIGVDSKHCNIFREQEITGDVLLDMDQSFIYMKEYDFGVMGRRLKTWHKIRDFQRDVKTRSNSLKTSDREQNSSLEDISRTSSYTTSGGPSLPRIPSLHERSLSLRQAQHTPPIMEEEGDRPGPLQPTQNNKRMSWAAQTPPSSFRAAHGSESPARVAGTSKDHTRPHSSIDFGKQPNLELSPPSTISHQKQASLDQTWSLAGSTLTTTPTSSLKPSLPDRGLEAPYILGEDSPVDIDRGYFSGTEVDNQKTRNRMSKAGHRGAHSRQISLVEQSSKGSSGLRKHSRLSSVEIPHDAPDAVSAAARTYHQKPVKGRFRSASARVSNIGRSAIGGVSPTVTNLEATPTSGLTFVQDKLSMQDRARKLMGFRATSEAVTPEEKSNVSRTTPTTDPSRTDLISPGLTTNSTPSGTPSLDIEAADTSARSPTTPVLIKDSRSRSKTKLGTSAYTRGLLKIPPHEARQHCDYSGWMKKKSSSLMTTWKPRLFILRGRRLSYYYSEDDTEERGIIDISGHKVLVANSEALTTIHASMTGATSRSSTGSASQAGGESPKPTTVFFFKLVPPRAGLPRAVQFTKPTIHYFQVDSIEQGRKWMGEIMKATIEHDLTTFESTNKQKTISLARARARKERPPALDDTKQVDELDEEVAVGISTGLNISGAGLQSSEVPGSTEKPLPPSVVYKPLPPQPEGESNKENIAGS